MITENFPVILSRLIFAGGLVVALALGPAQVLVSQELAESPQEDLVNEEQVTNTPETENLPRGFGDYQLESTWEDFQEILARRAHFEYRGAPDVSLLSRPNTHLIDVRGHTFFSRGNFQFQEGRLVVITLMLDPREFDYFTLYQTLEGRYGLPGYLDPRLARWEDSRTRIALEKPLTLRYIDLDVFNSQEELEHDRRTFESLVREQFLDQL